MILNLKKVNECVKFKKFCMESLYMIKEFLSPGVFMASIDLKDACLSHYGQRSLKKIYEICSKGTWKKKLSQFNALPFVFHRPPESL